MTHQFFIDYVQSYMVTGRPYKIEIRDRDRGG